MELGRQNAAARLEKIAGRRHRTIVASEALPQSAAVAGPISASFRSQDFSKRSVSTA
jgi:hypothetical protein